MNTIPRRLGKYELQQQIGRGSVGDVWKGHDLQLHRDVAIKILHTDLQSDPHFMTRFTKEGQVLASLHHTNIVQVHDINIARSSQGGGEATAYIVMEYIAGQTLTDYIQVTSRKGDFPSVDDIVYLFTCLGVAIDYAHQKGIVHGNIKPNNILLNRHDTSQFPAGEPLITDFGLAQLLSNAASICSPYYISPEQAKGLPASNRSDIYALGVILYELCTGVQPFRDESSVAVMMAHINTLPTPPALINPNIPPALSEVIMRAMTKDPSARFSMASLLATAIADACSVEPTIHIPPDKAAITQSEDISSPASNGANVSILGVAQPVPRAIPPMPLPGISGPLPPISGKYPAISSMQQTTGRLPLSGPLTTSGTNTPIPYAPTGQYSRLPNQPSQLSPSAQSPGWSSGFTSSGPLIGSQMLPAISPMPAPPQPMLLLPRASRRTYFSDLPAYIVVLSLLLLLLVVGSAIATSLLLNNNKNADTNLTGRVYFQDDALGHNDQLRIEMKNLPAPPASKAYYVWLMNTTQQLMPLGELPVRNGTASFIYAGDAKHTNLLSITQGIIITIENAGSTPTSPKGGKVYQASFDTMAYQYIKNILYSTAGLPGNQEIAATLLETVKSLNDKAGSIVDSLQGTHDYGLVRRQATRVIEIVDGTNFAQMSGDLPADTPAQLNIPIGLLSSPAKTGYIDILAAQLDKLQQVSANDAMLLQHVQNAKSALADLRDWVQKIRTYDVQILKAAKLADPAIISVALQLKQVAADSYTGRTIPPNQGPLPISGSAGAYQAYIECQYMASLAIQAV